MHKLNYNSLYHHNRNYGCRYHEIIYMGFKSLIIENELIRLTILYEKGTDIIELSYKPIDIDFMWRSPLEVSGNFKNRLTKEHLSGAFFDFYEGGWQELLPNINEPTNYKNSGLGLHGEVCFLPWDYRIIKDSIEELIVEFFVRMKRAPFTVFKEIKINSYSPVIKFKEKIVNEGNEDFKFMWGHHPAIGIPFLSEDCVIDLPENVIGHTYDKDFSGNSILPLDTEFKWPNLKLKNGKVIDISKVLPPDTKTAFCLYLKNFKDGWYGITNLDLGLGFGMRWDIKIFKYVWIWAVYRGYFGFPFYGRTNNIALELWSAVPGNLDEVIQNERELSLNPRCELKTEYKVIIYNSKNRIKGFDDADSPIS